MAEKEYTVDINLHGNEIKNFAIHNVNPESVQNPVDGQEVYFNGKIYVYDESIPNWVEQGTASAIAQVASDLSDEITRAEGAESTLQANIDAEETRAKAAEESLAGDIADEATARANADNTLQGNIDAEEAARIAADNTKVDKQIQGAHGKALIFNESDGGGAKFEHTDGTWSFVGVNDAGEGGLDAQIYALDKDTKEGSRIDVSTSGIYYTVGNQTPAQRMVEANEIATKGNLADVKAELEAEISEKDSLPERSAQTAGQFLTNDGTDASWADLPKYSMAKASTAESGYIATYNLTKDGVNVGASINIPKDFLVKSAEVKVCETAGVPVTVPALNVGDPYIDFVINSKDGSETDEHLYINAKSFVDIYTGSTYIDITNNVVSLKYSVLETKLQDTFYTESEIDAKVVALEAADTALDQAKADKATTLAGYNISDAYTKTEIDNMFTAKKQVVSCPALTASGSQFIWTFNNTVGADAIVTIYESSVEVIADITVTASTITIKMNETAELPSISAGQFKAVVLG